MSSAGEGRNMTGAGGRTTVRDPIAGTLLIAGALLGVVVMALHPTGQGLAADFQRQARLGAMVHGVAIADIPVVFLGLLGLWRRLGGARGATAGLVAYAWSGVAVLSAAVMSGFVSTNLIGRAMQAEDPAARTLYHALAETSYLMNQGYAKVFFVASCLAILFFSCSILATRRLAAAAGAAGVVIASLLLLLHAVGHLTMDVHGFGAMTIAQSLWFVAVGVLLCRDAPGAATRP
jgi:hypothetical protein